MYSHTFSNGITIVQEVPLKLYVFSASASVTSTDYVGTYDGISHSPTISVNNVDDYTIYYSNDTVINSSNYKTQGRSGLPFGRVPGSTKAFSIINYGQL